MKILIVEDGAKVSIENEGVSRTFTSFEDFFDYSGIDLTGKEYIDYEPENGVFIDESLDNPVIPYTFYDDVIEGVLDPYYRLSDKESKDLAYSLQVGAVESKKSEMNKEPFPYNGLEYKVIDNQIKDYQPYCLSLPADSAIPTFPQTEVLTGKWMTMDNTPVAFTCGEFLTLYNAIITRSTWNFDTRVQHQMMLSAIHNDGTKTAQDLLDYDYSGGWK